MSLFGPDLPPGFHYREEFISVDEERQLVAAIGAVEFGSFEMRGVVARRRVKFYGRSYDAVPGPEEPIPVFLFPLRDRLAAWAKVEPRAFAMALINEYQESAPIGWHRDAPQYEIIAGVSLLSSSRMKLRPYVAPQDVSKLAGPRKTTHEIELKPRSGYLITGEARAGYEHSIPPVTSLRYSVTFRTLRRAG
ncbi:MAG TPA: alpha-ketoglutarate-dependent dioxygenase AlkB [Vicinamibacterales bacterium]|nr:alpha-ketoglutarate-dependent dioxygenase AlkB [Vicinamibacterales bacterium]